MNEIFYTSDLHFGHAKIIEYCDRPFRSTQEMDQVLIENYCSVIDDSDIVYFLGDIAMGDRAYGLELVASLPGKKILLPGNHDYNHSMHKEKIIRKWAPLYEQAFDSVFAQWHPVQHWGDYTIKMSHFPDRYLYQGDDRYIDYKPSGDDVDFILCGHVHNYWKTLGHNVNVGVDVHNYMPVSQNQIRQILLEEGIV